MGVAFALRGRFEDTSGEAFLGRLKDWFENELASHHHWGELLVRCKLPEGQGKKPGMFVRFHPACEDIEFRVTEPRRILVTGKTSPGGPGYHIALMKVLKLMGEECRAKWSPAGKGDRSSADDTGYFFGGTREAVERSMLRYLGTLSNLVQEMLSKVEGHGEMALSMPLGHNYVGGPIRTPTGPRSMEWLARVRDDPRNGLDLFPWWEEGFTAGFHLGRAVCDMWMNVRWTTESEDEDKDRLIRMRRVHDDLCEAYRLDPTLTYPWREWAELIDLFKVDDAIVETVRGFAADAPDTPRIGYRRHRVGVALAGGWRIVIPGEMEEKWEEGSWCAWSEGRTVWFSSWTMTNDAGPPPDPDEMLANIPDGPPDEVVDGPIEPISYRDPPMSGRGTIRKHVNDDGKEMLNLRGFTAAPGTLALVNIYFDENDREWAVEQWKYLRHHDSQVAQRRVVDGQ